MAFNFFVVVVVVVFFVMSNFARFRIFKMANEIGKSKLKKKSI